MNSQPKKGLGRAKVTLQWNYIIRTIHMRLESDHSDGEMENRQRFRSMCRQLAVEERRL